MTPDEFLGDRAGAKQLYEAVRRQVDTIGDYYVRASKSQIAFRHRRPFAAVWMPDQYLAGRGLAPLVLSVFLRERDPSPRWKEVIEAAPGRFTHHLELRELDEVDEEVRGWLRRAWDATQ